MDRLYRNLKDYITLDELGLDIHMVKENEIFTKSSRSAQKFMHGIRVMMAKNYIDNLSEEVKKGLHTKANQHWWPSFAPPGYRNTMGEVGKRIIVPDPVPGPMVTKLFEWFASGQYSLKSLAIKAYTEGFRFRNSRNKVPVTTLHKILRKRIYTGDFDYAGVTYQGSHMPLVTQEVWNRVQNILDGRHETKGCRGRRAFPYSGMVWCGHCGCSLVGEVKKARYVYYHCTGYRGKCGEWYTREENLRQQFARGLGALIISPATKRWLTTELMGSVEADRRRRTAAERRDEAELERAQARLDMLYEDRLDGRVDAATYDRKAGEIRQEQIKIQHEIASAEANTLPPVQQAMLQTSQSAEEFPDALGAEQRRLLRLVLKEASWKGSELRMSLREPFEKLRLSNSVTGTNHKSLGAKDVVLITGGGRGIRTPERVTPLTVFKTAAFNHSAIPPSSILPDLIALPILSRCCLLLFSLPRHDCHYFVTGRQGRHGARLGVVVAVGVPHGRVDRRVPQEFFDSDEVHPGIREARGERMPEGVPGDAAEAGPPERRLPTGLEIEEPVAGQRVVKHVRPMFGRLLRFEHGQRRVIERHLQLAAGFAHDDRDPLLLYIHLLPHQVENVAAPQAGVGGEQEQFPQIRGRRGQQALLVRLADGAKLKIVLRQEFHQPDRIRAVVHAPPLGHVEHVLEQGAFPVDGCRRNFPDAVLLEVLDPQGSDGFQNYRPEKSLKISVHLLVALPGTLVSLGIGDVTLPEIGHRDVHGFDVNAPLRFGNTQGDELFCLTSVRGSGRFLHPFAVRIKIRIPDSAS